MKEPAEHTHNNSKNQNGECDVCAVCLEKIRHRDKLWNCPVCYNIVHLPCIQHWVKTQSEELEKTNWKIGANSSALADFRCPFCQSVISSNTVAEYKCFCGKVKDPAPDTFLLPGSCGQACGKRRKDPCCPHSCTLMCHPGPCPQCPLTRTQFCFCGKSEKTVGCSSGSRGFECSDVCGKQLDCGKHFCKAICHEGPCPVCCLIVKQSCFCGGTEKKVRCGEDRLFSCGKVCGRQLDCGNHTCQFNCHEGACQPCQRTPERQLFCPCGKVRVEQLISSPRKSCLDPIPSCGLVCGAPLPCDHTCSFICHEEPQCPPCVEVVKAKCQCGNSTVEYSCFCSYLPAGEWQEAAAKTKPRANNVLLCYPPKCNKRCRRHLSCGKHFCNEVCCSNEDHTCYQICTKRLPCAIHTCGQLCHKGPCAPCGNASYERLYCRCRRTWIEPPVPCGTKRPTCSYECVIPRPCGHRANHACHADDDCPVCVVPVEKRCDSHGKVMPYFMPCHLKSVSCGKRCGKALTCCGTTCAKICHSGVCEHKCSNIFPLLK